MREIILSFAALLSAPAADSNAAKLAQAECRSAFQKSAPPPTSLAQVYQSLTGIKMVKSEYETQSDYAQRAVAAQATVYKRAGLSQSGLVFTEYKLKLLYLPEEERFYTPNHARAVAQFSDLFPMGAKLLCTLQCDDIMQVVVAGDLTSRNTGSYAAQNGFGAKVRVQTASASGFGLSPRSENYGGIGISSRVFLNFEVPRAKAAIVGPKLRLMLCSRVVPPYTEKAFVRLPPSFENPHQEDRHIRALTTQSLAYAVVVDGTREVLSSGDLLVRDLGL
ncbi:MAG TPA: hypothetical protein VF559_07080 [Caulobacteraceae bacterium]|jgi:hypothetical protein